MSIAVSLLGNFKKRSSRSSAAENDTGDVSRHIPLLFRRLFVVVNGNVYS